jgi:hypothetical protein
LAQFGEVLVVSLDEDVQWLNSNGIHDIIGHEESSINDLVAFNDHEYIFALEFLSFH